MPLKKSTKDREFLFYSCNLEGRQLRMGETGLLQAKDVVLAICDADYQDNILTMGVPKTKFAFFHEYVKTPKDGMFLMNVINPTSHTSRLVFVDTRISPNMVWIEKIDERPEETRDIVNALENSFSRESDKYGWKIRLSEYKTNVFREYTLFASAIEYINGAKDVSDFRSVVIAEIVADDIIKLVDMYIKGKKKPKEIIRPFVAAKDAGAIGKLTKSTFVKTYGNLLGNSISALDKYMSDSYEWNQKDQLYLEMRHEFSIQVEKVRLGF